MKRLAVAALAMGLVGCAIEGPGPDDSDDDIPGSVDDGNGAAPEGPESGESDEPGPGEAVGDPANSDPPETEPGPEEEPPGTDPPEDPPEQPGPANNNANQVCYPGADMSYTTCFPVVSKGSWSGYNYPSHSSAAYAAPKRFVDLNAANASTKIAPNFTLGELMQAWKGQYGVYQVHMVDKLQTIRSNTGGALNVNSGYRRPAYNSSVGGATYSRHMYGDAADMYSSVVSLNSLKNHCNSLGADYVGMYSSHIHCDWRYETLDPSFYGSTSASWEGQAPMAHDRHDHSLLPAHVAALAVESDGLWRADATEFDEGEPYREWTAYDADGNILEIVAMSDYVPPADAAVVEVMIGGQKMLRANTNDPGNWIELPEGMVQVRLDTLADRFDAQDDITPAWATQMPATAQLP